jgi:hypothetical protein
MGIVPLWMLAPDMLGAVINVAPLWNVDVPCTKRRPPIETSDPTRTLELKLASEPTTIVPLKFEFPETSKGTVERDFPTARLPIETFPAVLITAAFVDPLLDTSSPPVLELKETAAEVPPLVKLIEFVLI